MSHSIYNCIDVGSENCPCYLAKTNDCLTCSRLQGKDNCDCNWKGLCVYNEFILNNQKPNYPRTEFISEIVSRKYYLDDLVVFELAVDKGFAIKTLRPGSYVFLRRPEDEKYYDVPISILHVDVEKSRIYLGIKIISPKTKALAEGNRAFMLRGPYRNGIRGMEGIPTDKKVLIVTKGIGVAPGIMAAGQLFEGNHITMLVDLDKITAELLRDFYDDDWGGLLYVELSQPEGRMELEKKVKEQSFDIVFLLMSDYYLDLLSKLIRSWGYTGVIAVSNNYRICCGEGICGSCVTTFDGGEVVKMCKCSNVHI